MNTQKFYKKEYFTLKVGMNLENFKNKMELLAEEKRRGKLYPRVEFRTTSFPLAQKIIKILESVSIHATLYSIKRKNKNWQDIMCISVRGFQQVKKFFKLVKPHNPKHSIKFKRLLTNGEADNRKVGSSNLPRPTQGPIA
jgi:intein/homing endonuclease